jgi:GT2 family glycosyltransferase
VSVAVVTPWFGHLELEEDYLTAIALGPDPDELIVVDNCSPEPIPFAAIRLDANKGFAGGSNAGLHHATADVVVFLNNDIIAVREGWLSDLVQACETGVLVGSRLRYDEHANVDGMSMPYLDGWCLGGMREDLLMLGGWDDSLEEPSYYSDNLLCLEARAAGFLLREVPTGLIHKGGMTSQANGHLLPSTLANRVVYEKRVRELVAEA